MNVSGVENERSREMVEEEGLGRLVGVREGCFEDLGMLPRGGGLMSCGAKMRCCTLGIGKLW